MPRVVSHVEVEAVSEGGTLRVEPGTLVTPLARDRARARNVSISEGPSGVGPQSPAMIRQVTRQVVARLPGESAEMIEAVVSEILGELKSHTDEGQRYAIGGPDAPNVDVCAQCLETERARSRSRAVLTVTGRNRSGIVAKVATALFELGADILDISQTLVADFFTMIVVFDTRGLNAPFDATRAELESRLAEIGMKATVMHEDVLQSLHRV